MNLRRWLTPGIGVKRWLLVAFIGLLLIAVGVAHALRQLSVDLAPGSFAASVVDAVTLQWLPYELRGIIAGALGVTLFVYGAYRLVRALVDPFDAWEGEQPMVEVIYQKRFLARGPRVVAIGGGTGLSTLLRGLKEHTSNLTAVVTVADDGGSSGVLRAELGIPAVGDIRNCIVALADAEPLMGRLLQYRFPGTGPAVDSHDRSIAGPAMPVSRDHETPPAGLGGHAVGNLILAALVQLEHGDFEQGVREMNRVLAVRGRVVPATGTVITLHARLDDGSEVVGQSRIAKTNRVDRVWVTPTDVRPTADSLEAIADAELIVLGPGQPVHQHPPRARRAGDPRGDRRVRCAGRVRVQRGDAAGRDRRVRPCRITSTRSLGTAPATWRTSSSPTTGSTRRRRRAGSASPCASSGRPAARAGRGSSSTTSSTTPTPTITTPSASRPR